MSVVVVVGPQETGWSCMSVVVGPQETGWRRKSEAVELEGCDGDGDRRSWGCEVFGVLDMPPDFCS